MSVTKASSTPKSGESLDALDLDFAEILAFRRHP